MTPDITLEQKTKLETILVEQMSWEAAKIMRDKIATLFAPPASSEEAVEKAKKIVRDQLLKCYDITTSGPLPWAHQETLDWLAAAGLLGVPQEECDCCPMYEAGY